MKCAKAPGWEQSEAYREIRMNVLILAINHQIQSARNVQMSSDGSAEAFEQSQKNSFEELLRDLIRNQRIGFVGEEAKHGDPTIAQQLCESENCQYANIDMKPEERERRQIPPGYADIKGITAEEKQRCNREREQYMCDLTLEKAGQTENTLLICGRLHAKAIAAILNQMGHNTETIDLQDYDWYIEDWIDHCMNNL
jgi:hypothetical protein